MICDSPSQFNSLFLLLFSLTKKVVFNQVPVFYFTFSIGIDKIDAGTVIYMAGNKPRAGSFSRNFTAASNTISQIPGLKHGPNGTMFLSSGILDLDSNFFSTSV